MQITDQNWRMFEMLIESMKQDGMWNHSEYEHGVANGMITAMHTLTGNPNPPELLMRPEKYYIEIHKEKSEEPLE
jgi:hypothetical protein